MGAREHRRDGRTPIDILLNKYIDGEPHLCRAVNLSRGGMLLYKIFEPDVPPGEVSLEFQLPGSPRVLRVDGVILTEHASSRSNGVRFVRMATEDRALLDSYLGGELLERRTSTLDS